MHHGRAFTNFTCFKQNSNKKTEQIKTNLLISPGWESHDMWSMAVFVRNRLLPPSKHPKFISLRAHVFSTVQAGIPEICTICRQRAILPNHQIVHHTYRAKSTNFARFCSISRFSCTYYKAQTADYALQIAHKFVQFVVQMKSIEHINARVWT